MENSLFTCQYCGKDTSEVEYDYLMGTDHLTCVLTAENKISDNYDRCVLCGVETAYKRSTHIDLRYNYVEGAGQLCNKCGNKDQEVITEADLLGTPNPSHMLIVVDETTILYTPNDAELGAKVRQIYWTLKKEQNGK